MRQNIRYLGPGVRIPQKRQDRWPIYAVDIGISTKIISEDAWTSNFSLGLPKMAAMDWTGLVSPIEIDHLQAITSAEVTC